MDTGLKAAHAMQFPAVSTQRVFVVSNPCLTKFLIFWYLNQNYKNELRACYSGIDEVDLAVG